MATLLTAVAGNAFTVTYDVNKNSLNIESETATYWNVFSDADLRNPITQWGTTNAKLGLPPVTIADLNHIGSVNDIIQNYGVTQGCNDLFPYASGYLNFLRYNNIYISSNLGSYQILGPRPGQRDIVRKVPVTAGSGLVINSRVVSKHDILDCAKICMSTLEFRFQDMYGNTINLNGNHVSFSLVFTTMSEDT